MPKDKNYIYRPATNLRQHGDDVRWASFSGPRYPVLVSVRQWLGKAQSIHMRAHAQFWSESFSCCFAGEEEHFHHVGQRSVCAILPDILRMNLDARKLRRVLNPSAVLQLVHVDVSGLSLATGVTGPLPMLGSRQGQR